MSRIFLSYSQRDSTLALAIADAIRKFGHDVYFANEAPVAMFATKEEIFREISRSDAMVILLSRTSVDSKWVRQEFAFASGFFREKGKVIFPVLLDEVEIPSDLNGLLYFRSADPSAIANRLHSALLALEGRKSAEEEEKKISRERVKSTAPQYIRESLDVLEKRERNYRALAYLWYVVGFATIVCGIGIALYRSLPVSTTELSWPDFAQRVSLLVVLIGFLGAAAKFSFTLGKSFMVEALRNSDRIHAIRFGEFYLKAFPEKIEWKEIKEAFQHWNIDSGSAFISQDASKIDPQVLEHLSQLLKELRKKEDA